MKRTFTIEVPYDSIRLHPGDIAQALKPMTGDDITVTEVTTRYYHVWREGNPAKYHGPIISTSLQEGCDFLFSRDKHYDSSKLTLCGRKLFDNEQAARKAFG